MATPRRVFARIYDIYDTEEGWGVLVKYMPLGSVPPGAPGEGLFGHMRSVGVDLPDDHTLSARDIRLAAEGAMATDILDFDFVVEWVGDF